ncbi:M56 family metallopeptidase [Longimicrobium sp.]|uniref:M56 family metallopeptidase n=1 Tax=Longimicrobium sp. TaxID=2029185 RepID=UPI003B3BDFE5
MNALLDSPLAGAVLDAAVRGTFILLAALGATALMRRTSASARHLVWLAALTALLLLPVARRFVPEWRVLPVPSAVLVAPTDDLDSVLDSAALDQVAPTAGVAGVAAPSVAPSTPQPVRIPSDWKRLALLAWAAGAALFALRLAYGLARVWWMERRAVELTDEEWVRLTDGLSRRLRLGRIVRLLREPGATVPMTWGIFHPVILLPGEADGWESERRRVVLAHELAHVRRWDALTQWIAHVALVVYWFNPLVWMAVRKLREEREHACDDAVLEIGTAPADYADHLLTIVRSLGSAPGPAPAHALAMARRSQFEGRLLAILDNAVRRNGVSRAAALATSAAALACLVPLAAMRPADPALAAAAHGQEAAAEKPASPAARLANRVAEAVQKVTRTETEEERSREAALDAAASVAKTASALRAEPGSASVSPLVTVGPVATASLSTTGFAGLLRVLETRTDPELYADIIRAAEEIESSTDRRVVLERLLAKSDLSHDNVVAIIAATRTMGSDTDKRVVLERAVRHRALRANPLPHVFYEAMRTFSSSTDQRVVLSSLLGARRLDSACLELLLQHVPRLESSSDQRVVLTDAVRTQRIEGRARDAFLAAARAMDSDTDRRVALSALTDLDEAPAEATHEAPATGTARTSTTRSSESTESVWDSDIGLELGGRAVEIQAKQVVFGRGRWDIRRIRAGGSLMVQETRGGVVRRLSAIPGEDGRPVYTYTVDGRARTFDPGARSWFEAVIREFTGD